MTLNEVEGHWHQLVGAAKKRWARLTDDDVAECEGNRNVLISKLQQLYEVSTQDAEREIEEMESRIKQVSEGGRRHYGGDE